MNSMSSLNADWVSPPGNTLVDFMEFNGSSLSDVASELDCDIRFLKRLLEGSEEIDLQLAGTLSTLTGVSSSFWLKREEQYRANIDRVHQQTIDSKQWISDLPVADMVKFGWIEKASTYKQKLINCLKFFEVSSVAEWRSKYGTMIGETAFRTSERFSQKTESVASWLKQGEIQVRDQTCEPWNKDKLQALLPKLRELTNDENPSSFIPKLRSYLSSCGVLLAVVPTPTNCPASGAAYWMSDSKALIILSFRYLKDDHFWFTFFHEIGHLLLHPTYSLILESDSNVSEIEQEANKFSEETLIPFECRNEFNLLTSNNLRGILKFARKIGVSKGIVVGQMQHKGLISKSTLNKLKVRYSWELLTNP